MREITKKASSMPIVGGTLQTTEIHEQIPIKSHQKPDQANNQ